MLLKHVLRAVSIVRARRYWAIQHNLNSGTLRFRLPTAIRRKNESLTVLSAYDDLIENNTRRIKILEEMAQMIYREWFVNFRFPGHEKVEMVESEIGADSRGMEV